MRQFYHKAILSFFGLVIASLLVGYWCFSRTFLHVTLLPADQSGYAWHITLTTDVEQKGRSQLGLIDEKFDLSFNFQIVPDVEYPYATVGMEFVDAPGKPRLIDLSKFTSISFNVKCTPSNTLNLSFLSFDKNVSVENNIGSYRLSSTYFSCSENWTKLDIDLTHLETPEWWFAFYKQSVASREYKLDKVRRINWGNSFQSPRNLVSIAQIHDLQLNGRNWIYLYIFVGLMLVVWVGYAVWFFRLFTRAMISDLQDKHQRDRQFVAYQQLSLEPHRDKDKSAILRFIATEYANPEVNLEVMAAATGVTRTKINDVLKTELGYTFTGYLNRLRLTEAARLLAATEEANIAEIAYSVGYRNVSYFNKLFKEEYGCTPKTFKGLRGGIQPDGSSSPAG